MWYQSTIGFLIWPTIHIHPNIFYSINVLSQDYVNLGLIHCNLVTQIFWYLAGMLDFGITFESNFFDKLVEYNNLD